MDPGASRMRNFVAMPNGPAVRRPGFIYVCPMNTKNVLSCSDVLQQLCKATGKWGLYISFVPLAEGDWWGEVVQAAPYLAGQAPFFDCGWMLFDTREEMDRHFAQTVGDDGPTPTNPYTGPVKVYALTCNPNGDLESENT